MIMNRMDMLAWLRKQLEDADADLLREMVQTLAEMLMGRGGGCLSHIAFANADLPVRAEQTDAIVPFDRIEENLDARTRTPKSPSIAAAAG